MTKTLHLGAMRDRLYGRAQNPGATDPPQVLGLFNFRDVGGNRVSATQHVRKNFLFRSATLSNVSPAGLRTLHSHYGIETIFNLRTGTGSGFGTTVQTVEGLTMQTVATMDSEASQEPLLEHFHSLSQDLVTGFMVIYKHLCVVSGAAYREILAHIRDQPTSPLLVNCDLGKDETGVFVGILLKLLGVPDEDIIEDYHRSETQIEPLVSDKRARVLGLPIFEDLAEVDIDKHFLAPREVMRALLVYIDLTYGGAGGYLRFLGFAEAEIDLVRRNMLESDAPQ
ncbi:tyrosine-protein phosphatase [Aspergillus clavatus NRRL 1]|uniref:Tyrosine specific protein phosphatases domain-containing protein n=1 Tax=Aspergillus clavatus (strain ATCC 1007 / CBS 513.65 / DSM 816 / NCTC 3887 / NRRL 1 / QM 1276 / 107) TaxID=344612 RepID=A1CBV7_ASPCL|nr:uncharacterized protein ACLA_016710 [Aspergillus clavatus NRRL 1]EAW13225.1 hypothetical protein ACLA_016710 [Aspergillus clavatus NRRL 1]